MNITKKSLIIFLASMFMLNTQVSYSESEQEDKYKLHSESSDRLITIMQELFFATPDGIAEPVIPSNDDLETMIENAEELLFYAELMSMKVPISELDENKKVIFSAMASQLYDETLNIQQLVKNYDVDSGDMESNVPLQSSYERLHRTCSACHDLFRGN